MSVWPACMYMHYVRALYMQKSKEDIGSPGTGLIDSDELLHGLRESKPESTTMTESTLNH